MRLEVMEDEVLGAGRSSTVFLGHWYTDEPATPGAADEGDAPWIPVACKVLHKDWCQLPHSLARPLFQQFLLALHFCHKLGLSNRDCKITDLLVRVSPDNGAARLQLTDFSFAKDSERDADSNPMAQHGSMLFAAPEVIVAPPLERYCGQKADVWSAGVVLCTLLFGCHPHLPAADLDRPQCAQLLAIIDNGAQGRIMVPPQEAAAQPDAFSLMALMLTPDPAARPDAAAVLLHPWLRSGLASDLADLNERLLADTNLRAEAAAKGEAMRARVAGMLERLLGPSSEEEGAASEGAASG
ncbi:Serine/threonine-protein kinase SAPK10 [Tetrabaena socialis]|uniref:Serine/threonine-protein kinase SAPK10 n=1 Tax=Tetrabaena socialis TaxID=47790 RepID=A0A2J8AGM8_9CHLO|nr:Serine/threonine-protein kinase SAPK10 [Tetrabaena socialis]|eukprot:PNH11661.1 Serine/threonine-protein kinase SAPK10 [Tetrabaena socialis]